MSSVEERIKEAKEDLAWIRAAYTFVRASRPGARVTARAERRLADLEAVRDGKAREVYATVCISVESHWAARGYFDASDPLDSHVMRDIYDEGDRITILRGIAYLPVNATEEAEAESEEP